MQERVEGRDLAVGVGRCVVGMIRHIDSNVVW
jgi:hypothetical protein